jgi:hypothetical protein
MDVDQMYVLDMLVNKDELQTEINALDKVS